VDILHGSAGVVVLHPHAHAHILHLKQLRAAHTEVGPSGGVGGRRGGQKVNRCIAVKRVNLTRRE
jgi:hypothetical protein